MSALSEAQAFGIPSPSGNGAFLNSINLPRQASQIEDDISIHSHVSSLNDPRATNTVVKDITFWGGLSLLICNTTGPGATSLPLVAQNAGWVPTLIGFLLVGLLSYLSCMFICEAMAEVPGNDHFQANVEFSNLVFAFFGRKYQIIVQLICFFAMQTTIIASIAICAQVFDNLLICLFRKTCGVQIYPSITLICATEQLPSASPFSGVMIISTGALVAFVLVIPLCLMNLSENIWLQAGSCILILLIFIQWFVTFFQHGLVLARVPAIGSDISQTFGSILFNYAFVACVPSLANAKKANVSLHKTIGTNVSLMTTIFILVSILGAMAFEIPTNSTLVQAITSSPDVSLLSRIAGFTFPVAALITSIPVNMIVLRYNLIQSRACSNRWAKILAGCIPWLFAIPGMTGSLLMTIVDWSSLFFVSTANFVIPFILFIHCKRLKKRKHKLAVVDEEKEAEASKGSATTAITDLTMSPEEKELTIWGRLTLWCERRTSRTSVPEKFGQCPSLDSLGATKEKHDATKIAITGGDPETKGDGATIVSSPTQPRDSRACTNEIEEILPPFLSGNNYMIPGLSRIQSKLVLDDCLLRPTGSDLSLQWPRPAEVSSQESVRSEGALSKVVDMEDELPQHHGDLKSQLKMRAVPRWIPGSGVAVAWVALFIMHVGIIMTIIVKIVQL
ncbi:hypothetical protein BX616_010354 [Lobosporangium transversale]|nr:hypothetical protein BX616_010354 [Lobosporangium transversale]